MKDILQKNVSDETQQYSLKTQKSCLLLKKNEELSLLQEIKLAVKNLKIADEKYVVK